jgi:hypothetical protein
MPKRPLIGLLALLSCLILPAGASHAAWVELRLPGTADLHMSRVACDAPLDPRDTETGLALCPRQRAVQDHGDGSVTREIRS